MFVVLDPEGEETNASFNLLVTLLDLTVTEIVFVNLRCQLRIFCKILNEKNSGIGHQLDRQNSAAIKQKKTPFLLGTFSCLVHLHAVVVLWSKLSTRFSSLSLAYGSWYASAAGCNELQRMHMF